MILVVGSQRTGSTLMSWILDAHPALNNLGDVDLPDVIGGEYGVGDVLHANFWTARYRPISESHPGAKYVFMLRNLLDVVGSMLVLDWGTEFIAEETARALIGVSDWYQQHRALHFWKKAMVEGNRAAGLTIGAYLKSYMLQEYEKSCLTTYPVSYEKLASRPENTLKRLVGWLGLEWSPDMLNHHSFAESGVFTGNDLRRSIDAKSVEAWRRRMTPRQIDQVRETTRVMDGIFGNFAVRRGIIDPREQDTCDRCGSFHIGGRTQGRYVCAASCKANEGSHGT